MRNGKILGVHPNVFSLGLVSLLNDLSSEMVGAVLTLYLATTLHAPSWAIGMIGGFSVLVTSVGWILSGSLSDRIQRRKVIAIAGYSVSVVSRLFLGLSSTVAHVAGFRALDRLGKGFREAPRDALLIESVPKTELAYSFNFQRAFDTIGGSAGPLLAFLMLPVVANDYRAIFMLSFFIGFGALIPFFFVKDVRRSAPRPEVAVKFRAMFRDPNLMRVLLSIFIFGLGNIPLTLTLLKAREVLGDNLVPLVYFLYGLMAVAVYFPIGVLADRFGERKLIVIGLAVAAASYFALSFAGTTILVLVLFSFLGISSAFLGGLPNALVSRISNPELLASTQGVLNVALGTSSLIGGSVAGLFWTLSGPSGAFWFASFFLIVGVIVFAVATKPEARVRTP